MFSMAKDGVAEYAPPLILRDDFDGSGVLEGRVVDGHTWVQLDDQDSWSIANGIATVQGSTDSNAHGIDIGSGKPVRVETKFQINQDVKFAQCLLRWSDTAGVPDAFGAADGYLIKIRRKDGTSELELQIKKSTAGSRADAVAPVSIVVSDPSDEFIMICHSTDTHIMIEIVGVGILNVATTDYIANTFCGLASNSYGTDTFDYFEVKG